jgi:uncharacterized protein YjbI with pentapeptide repeats
LAIGGLLLSLAEKRREQSLADRRAEVDRSIAADQTREAALQAYLDDMIQLLLTGRLQKIPAETPPGSEEEQNIRIALAARVRTLSVLPGLDPVRRGVVLRLLSELRLIHRDNRTIPLNGADFSGVDLSRQQLNLKGVDLSHALLENAIFDNAYLVEADFNGAQLRGARFCRANIERALFFGAQMDLVCLDRANCQGAAFDGATIRDASALETDFSEQVSRNELRDVVVRRASLGGADFSRSVLDGANFEGAFMRQAKFSGAHLAKVNFKRADLCEAAFDGAVLEGSNFEQALTEGIKPDGIQNQTSKD